MPTNKEAGTWKVVDGSDFNMADAMQEMITEAEVVNPEKLFDNKLIEYDKPHTEEANSELNNLLQRSFKEVIEKNNIKNIEYKDFKSIIDGLSKYSKQEAEFNRLYLSKLVSAVTDASTIRAVMALGFLIDTAIAKIMEIAKNQTGESFVATVATIEKTLLWIEKIEELKRRYYISGADSSLKQLSAQQSTDTEQKLSISDIRDLISKANEKPKEETKQPENKETK